MTVHIYFLTIKTVTNGSREMSVFTSIRLLSRHPTGVLRDPYEFQLHAESPRLPSSSPDEIQSLPVCSRSEIEGVCQNLVIIRQRLWPHTHNVT